MWPSGLRQQAQNLWVSPIASSNLATSILPEQMVFDEPTRLENAEWRRFVGLNPISGACPCSSQARACWKSNRNANYRNGKAIAGLVKTSPKTGDAGSNPAKGKPPFF